MFASIIILITLIVERIVRAKFFLRDENNERKKGVKVFDRPSVIIIAIAWVILTVLVIIRTA